MVGCRMMESGLDSEAEERREENGGGREGKGREEREEKEWEESEMKKGKGREKREGKGSGGRKSIGRTHTSILRLSGLCPGQPG